MITSTTIAKLKKLILLYQQICQQITTLYKHFQSSNLYLPSHIYITIKLPGPSNPMSNPTAMMDMVKGQMSFMLPNIAMMTFVGMI